MWWPQQNKDLQHECHFCRPFQWWHGGGGAALEGGDPPGALWSPPRELEYVARQEPRKDTATVTGESVCFP